MNPPFAMRRAPVLGRTALFLRLALASAGLAADPSLTLEITHLAPLHGGEPEVLGDFGLRLSDHAGDSDLPVRLDADLQVRGPRTDLRSAGRITAELGVLRIFRAPLDAGSLLAFLDDPTGPGLTPASLDPPSRPGPGDCSWDPSRPALGLGLATGRSAAVPLEADLIGWRSPGSGRHLTLVAEPSLGRLTLATALHAASLPRPKPSDDWFPSTVSADGPVVHAGLGAFARPGAFRVSVLLGQVLRPWTTIVPGARPLLHGTAGRFNLVYSADRLLLGLGGAAGSPAYRGLDGDQDSDWLAAGLRIRIGPTDGTNLSVRLSTDLQHPPSPPHGVVPQDGELEVQARTDASRALAGSLSWFRSVESVTSAPVATDRFSIDLGADIPVSGARLVQASLEAAAWAECDHPQSIPWTQGLKLALSTDWDQGVMDTVDGFVETSWAAAGEDSEPEQDRELALGLSVEGELLGLSVEYGDGALQVRFRLRR